MDSIEDIRHQENQTRLSALERDVREIKQQFSEVFDAFPNRDLEGHRRYHVTMIETLEEKRRLRVAIQEKTISGLVWATLVFLGFACWDYLQKKLGMSG